MCNPLRSRHPVPQHIRSDWHVVPRRVRVSWKINGRQTRLSCVRPDEQGPATRGLAVPSYLPPPSRCLRMSARRTTSDHSKALSWEARRALSGPTSAKNPILLTVSTTASSTSPLNGRKTTALYLPRGGGAWCGAGGRSVGTEEPGQRRRWRRPGLNHAAHFMLNMTRPAPA